MPSGKIATWVERQTASALYVSPAQMRKNPTAPRLPFATAQSPKAGCLVRCPCRDFLKLRRGVLQFSSKLFVLLVGCLVVSCSVLIHPQVGVCYVRHVQLVQGRDPKNLSRWSFPVQAWRRMARSSPSWARGAGASRCSPKTAGGSLGGSQRVVVAA